MATIPRTSLFLNGTVPTDIPGHTVTISQADGSSKTETYSYGEFIHSITGSNDNDNVAACYGGNALRSTEVGASNDCFYKVLPEGTTTNSSKYNNIEITLYQIGDDVVTGFTGNAGNRTYTIEGDSKFETLKTNGTFDFENKLTAANLYKDLNDNSTVPTQINYEGNTVLDDQIIIPGNTVYNFVIKVEYLDTDTNQNAENLAALNIKVDISA